MSGDLAARQAALVAALVDGAADPAGMDAARLHATRTALLRKRSGLAAREWPLLAAGLGADWTAFAVAELAGRPVADGLRDGWVLARAARDRGLLTDGAARELAARERAYRFDGVRPPRPRLRSRLRRGR
ncbi:hypothetical protein [Pseudonocardia oroxyli]|uniref:SCO6045-like C-terminal domain-containing protein n=1 Tax=Pseudonocardia oroxyli TaxID=366584 RepID=A0A1G7GXP9_PSEOR|nr:hypothetical protein [Pseudonocardia oroxyli]SDE92926.1 hypothetical protein SAMN05216377_102492 [Pseudonocardia oroxyli]